MAKSADAFRTISEVADWLDTPAHVLRFWESKFSQVKPVKRAGGRRYYRPTDMQLLGGIKKLLHGDGMTIKGVQKMLRESGVKHVAALSQPLEAEEEIISAAPIDSSTVPDDPVIAFVPPGKEANEHSAPSSEAPTPPMTAKLHEESSDSSASAVDSEEHDSDAVPEADLPSVMPTFSHKQDAEPSGTRTDEAQPKTSAKVDVPDDPADDVASEPGVLSKVAALHRPLSRPTAVRMAPILIRLRDIVIGPDATDRN